MNSASDGNSNINDPLLPLRAPIALRVQADSRIALNRFLDPYAGSVAVTRMGTIAAAGADLRAFR